MKGEKERGHLIPNISGTMRSAIVKIVPAKKTVDMTV